jgi:predicted nucleic acid-binding protein
VKLYLDASAWIKRYLVESGSDVVREAAAAAEERFMLRIGFVETVAAIAREAGAARVQEFRSDWPLMTVVEVDEALAERAAELAVSDRLGALDALHLASALLIPGEDVVLATWDRRLHAAAQARGLATLPEALA